TFEHWYGAARVSKRPTHRSAACLRARRRTDLAWLDLESHFIRRTVMKKFLRASLPALYLGALVAVAGAQSRSLDGTWQFAVDREGKLTINDLNSVKDWREIRVPLEWNAQFADLRDYRGVAWYRKTVDLQPIKPDQNVLLKFGAVDYFAEVFVNGKKVGEHEGGYLPFTLGISNLAKAGANEIVVRVTDPDNDKARWGDMNYAELPHGKQSWYVQTGGIWQPVTLLVSPKNRITDVFVTAKLDGGVEVFVRTLTPMASRDGKFTA